MRYYILAAYGHEEYQVLGIYSTRQKAVDASALLPKKKWDRFWNGLVIEGFELNTKPRRNRQHISPIIYRTDQEITEALA